MYERPLIPLRRFIVNGLFSDVFARIFYEGMFSLHTRLILICCDLQACGRERQLDEQRQ